MASILNGNTHRIISLVKSTCGSHSKWERGTWDALAVWSWLAPLTESFQSLALEAPEPALLRSPSRSVSIQKRPLPMSKKRWERGGSLKKIGVSIETPLTSYRNPRGQIPKNRRGWGRSSCWWDSLREWETALCLEEQRDGSLPAMPWQSLGKCLDTTPCTPPSTRSSRAPCGSFSEFGLGGSWSCSPDLKWLKSQCQETSVCAPLCCKMLCWASRFCTGGRGAVGSRSKPMSKGPWSKC